MSTREVVREVAVALAREPQVYLTHRPIRVGMDHGDIVLIVGVRDVVNGLGVEPPEEDSDLEITDAVRIALEKDPLVKSANLQVTTHSAVVRLTGAVESQEEARAAEHDAWCIFGVDRVENELRVSPGPGASG